MSIKTPLLILILAGTAHSHAQLSTEAADEISQQINKLMSGYTDTVVTPTDGREAVIVLSTKVLATEKISKLWHFVAACAVGQYYNENAGSSVEQIWFADRVDFEANPMRYAVLKLPVAKSVQSQVYYGGMDFNAGQVKIWKSLERKSLAKK